MATNKHAIIRYHALDRCFSNHGKKFFIENLIDACNDAIYDFSGIKDGVKRRQIFKDITFLESEHGWSVPLERVKHGRRVYYRYTDKSFSIKNQGVNQSEAEQLQDTLSILSRFKGLPQFEWVDEMQIRLEDTFKLKGNVGIAVGFEENPYLRGLNYFTELFNAIQNKVCLLIKYKGFRQVEAIEVIFHPWFLKQFNNRWFLFGFNDNYQSITNMAIDRIISIGDCDNDYKPNTEVNFEEYFEDVIGVTIKKDAVVENIVIKASTDIWSYIESKPIHGSQKVKLKTETEILFELNLQINYELISLLFSYKDSIEILEPVSFRDKFKSISENIFFKYT